MTLSRPVRLGIAFFTLQGTLCVIWWLVLFLVPTTRRHFLPAGFADANLWTLLVADLVLYVGGSLAVAAGLRRQRPWAWPILCIHAGGAAYAALYAISLPLVWRGDGWLGAVMMTPSLLVPPWFVWTLRPR